MWAESNLTSSLRISYNPAAISLYHVQMAEIRRLPSGHLITPSQLERARQQRAIQKSFQENVTQLQKNQLFRTWLLFFVQEHPNDRSLKEFIQGLRIVHTEYPYQLREIGQADSAKIAEEVETFFSLILVCLDTYTIHPSFIAQWIKATIPPTQTERENTLIATYAAAIGHHSV